jgi:hypothetical protein
LGQLRPRDARFALEKVFGQGLDGFGDLNESDADRVVDKPATEASSLQVGPDRVAGSPDVIGAFRSCRVAMTGALSR